MRRWISIILFSLLVFSVMATSASAFTPLPAPDNGLHFKEIIWDAGWIWLIMLVMGLALIFDIVRGVIANARGEKDKEELPGKKKPSFEIIVRRRIE